MAIKKSDLYSSLWASCDELRGGMGARQYKDYVLFMLFIKYVSDKYGDTAIKSYKKQQGKLLSASNVENLVGDVLLSSFEQLTGLPNHSPTNYRGGTLFDDVVDSAVCLATALSYANGIAHVWQDPENPDDGHIIAPGTLQELLAGRTRPL